MLERPATCPTDCRVCARTCTHTVYLHHHLHSSQLATRTGHTNVTSSPSAVATAQRTTHTCSSTVNRTVRLQCQRHPHRCRLPHKEGHVPKLHFMHLVVRAWCQLRAGTRAQLCGTFSSAALITHVSSQAYGLPTYAASRAPAPAPAPRLCRVCTLRQHDKTTVHRFAGFLLQGAGTNAAQGRRTRTRAAPPSAQDTVAVLYTACRGANSYA